MPRGRFISRTLSTSNAYARLFDVAGDLAEFAQSLYPLLVVHADDFGRGQGDVLTIKYQIAPRSPRTEEEFSRALEALEAAGLIHWYESLGRQCYQIAKFDQHQQGLHRRTRSFFEPPKFGSGNFPETPGNSRLREVDQDPRSIDPNPDPREAARDSLKTVRRHLRAAVHRTLDIDPECPIGELAEMIKRLAKPLSFTWNSSREIYAIVDGVIQERAKRTPRTRAAGNG